MKIANISPNITCSGNKPHQIELICNATGNPIPTLAWTYNHQILASSTNESSLLVEITSIINSAITQGDDNRFVGVIQTKFVIENKQSDSVQIKLILGNCSIGVQRFKCIAINKFSMDQQIAIVTGELKPVILARVNETFEPVTEGNSIAMDCNAIGYPDPTIIWLKVYVFFLINTV